MSGSTCSKILPVYKEYRCPKCSTIPFINIFFTNDNRDYL